MKKFAEYNVPATYMKKTLLIPIAALALTATSASAFNPEILEDIGLSDTQISAFEEAHELRAAGDRDAARDVLVDAGIDEETLEEVRDAMKEARAEIREAIDAAVQDEDYDAFLDAVAGTPLEDKITSEDNFDLFVEAQALRADGDREGAREILSSLGIEGKERKGGHRGGDRDITNAPFWGELSASQQEDIQAAIADGDRDSVKEILESAGIERPERGDGERGGKRGGFSTEASA